MESVIIKIEHVNKILWFRAGKTAYDKDGNNPKVDVKGFVRLVEPSASSSSGTKSHLETSLDSNIGVPDEDMTGGMDDFNKQVVGIVKGLYDSLVDQFEKDGTDKITLELKVLHKNIGKI